MLRRGYRGFKVHLREFALVPTVQWKYQFFNQLSQLLCRSRINSGNFRLWYSQWLMGTTRFQRCIWCVQDRLEMTVSLVLQFGHAALAASLNSVAIVLKIMQHTIFRNFEDVGERNGPTFNQSSKQSKCNLLTTLLGLY